MFERYTEKARRAIFFARYEASQFGSSYIETEHLLLGLFREDRALARRFAHSADYEPVRKQIEGLTAVRESVSTSVDLPLSNECKRILAYAAEEAERLSHRHIGTEHLLLGMLREEKSLAAQLLQERGVKLEIVREHVALEPHETPAGALQFPRKFRVHNTLLEPAYVIARTAMLRQFQWEKRNSEPRDFLVENATGKLMFYSGQPFDAQKFTLRPQGWRGDHCAVCDWEISDAADPGGATGYTNGRDWVCAECYEKFLRPHIPPPGGEIYT